ncbi:prepilin-type N-terminal cleavage/methylation domain-containing protein [Patescibacteria group bacterium]|nr:prepilin-type N-terminal cleavage/methylation domain-containing protein [Patescibacteria group bacterium]
MQKGFTLIEVLAASFIIIMGVGGAMALIQQSISFTSNAALQLEASYLAQEGMEIVRNIRDTNLLKIHKGVGGNWTDGLIDPDGDGTNECAIGCQSDYAQSFLTAYQDTLLQFSNGFYSHIPSTTDSIFKRKITVTSLDPDILEVLVEVMWEERGRSHTVKAATKLYNWLLVAP